MRPANLEAWQVYAARCRRLDAENAAKQVDPWIMRTGLWAEILGLLMGAELLALCWLAGLF